MGLRKTSVIVQENIAKLQQKKPHLQPKPNPGSPAKIASREFEEKAFELRKCGHSYNSIAKQCSVTQAAAYQAVMRVLDRMETDLKEPAKKIRAMELAKLDRAEERISDKVEKGDLFAIDRFLKISERRARLTGIDAPTKLQHSGDEDNPVVIQQYSDVELQRELNSVAVLLGYKPISEGAGTKTILGSCTGIETPPNGNGREN